MLRFWNNDALAETERVAAAILAELEAASPMPSAPSPLPSPRTRGARPENNDKAASHAWRPFTLTSPSCGSGTAARQTRRRFPGAAQHEVVRC